MPVRLGIVEDNDRLADDLLAALLPGGHFELGWRAASLAQARLHVAEAVDLLLLDLGLPDGSGVELVADFRRLQPGIRIVAHTVFDSERQVMLALQAGVDGYLLKGAAVAQVEEALQAAMSGGTPLSPAVARYLLRQLRGEAPRNAETDADAQPILTGRERDVLEHLARGYSYRETAESLGIRPHTVAHHAKNLYSKLAVHSCSEAVFEAARSGLIRLG